MLGKLQEKAGAGAFNYPRSFVQDGKTSDYYFKHQFAGQIPELTDGLTSAGLKAISESIRENILFVYFKLSYPQGVQL